MATVEPIPNRSDTTKAKRLAWLRYLAHEGVMLNRMTRVLGRAERLEKFAASGNAKDLESYSDDMGVNLGNETHNHYEWKGGGAMLAILLLWALGMTTLLGIFWWQSRKPPVLPTFTDTDTTTRYYFAEPKPID